MTSLPLRRRIDAFIALGHYLQSQQPEERQQFHQAAAAHNAWFVPEYVDLAIDGLCRYLSSESIETWLRDYNLADYPQQPQRIGVIMAGNIPLAGIHDLICVLLSGHLLHAKPSSQDPFLPKAIAGMLSAIEPAFGERIVFAEQLKGLDAYIATGSDNSARYFSYYFGRYPHIIRQNRISVAVLTGDESPDELAKLAFDVLSYFGLGCRNVAKLLVPEGYDFMTFLKAAEGLAAKSFYHHKYANNYDYNKSIYLINQVPHLDTGGLLLTPSEEWVSPVSVLYWQAYRHDEELHQLLSANQAKIQCVVGRPDLWPKAVPFGQAQYPQVTDYADGIDTLAFLTQL